uniref:Uncharacterized protein n=1 Tax=Chloropicon laureae TaxID=464258 RepID=A0A7S2Z7F9_9CHLO|mmetsp:Transcript_8615/g.22058  ORF Transcript_8615/g.22058 Transcript_8615/m.22058 type:complete len:246 (+) Transcript_8615:3-740(+)
MVRQEVGEGGGGQRLLCMSEDVRKDQTYFLASLKREQVDKCLFPLGCFEKGQVRELAHRFNLPNKERKDSQGICFLGKVNFDEFIEKHLGTREGALVEDETKEVLGTHRGYWFHTIGQRKGIGLSHGPWYVTSKDIGENIVYISRTYHDESRKRSEFLCSGFNWLQRGVTAMDALGQLQCKVRHGPAIYKCTFEWISEGGEGEAERARVAIEGKDHGFAPGQYAVFYDQGVCLGSAVITGMPAPL